MKIERDFKIKIKTKNMNMAKHLKQNRVKFVRPQFNLDSIELNDSLSPSEFHKVGLDKIALSPLGQGIFDRSQVKSFNFGV